MHNSLLTWIFQQNTVQFKFSFIASTKQDEKYQLIYLNLYFNSIQMLGSNSLPIKSQSDCN